MKTTEIKTLKHLMKALRSTEAEINNVIANKESFYYPKPEISKDKRGNPKLDKTGNPKIRILYPTKGRLKELQYTIQSGILSKISLPENVKGGVKGWSNV